MDIYWQGPIYDGCSRHNCCINGINSELSFNVLGVNPNNDRSTHVYVYNV
jgi:hypothetical protein